MRSTTVVFGALIVLAVCLGQFALLFALLSGVFDVVCWIAPRIGWVIALVVALRIVRIGYAHWCLHTR